MLVHLKPNQAPKVAYERAYWKEHKIVPQKRTIMKEVDGVLVKAGSRALKKCYFFSTSGTGMCPSLLAQGKSSSKDGRCTKFCRACEKPFHDICSWVYHSHILKGFDVDSWIKEVWRRESLQSPVHSEGCESEEDEIEM